MKNSLFNIIVFVSTAITIFSGYTGALASSLPGPVAGVETSSVPAYNLAQTISDGAQRTTLAFSGLAIMTGNLEAQSFFPPGKVADYTGFQYLRDNDPDSMGHNTSFLTKVANNVIYILNDSQFEQLKVLAISQQDQINQYGYKRFPLMQAAHRLLDGDIPAGSTGLDMAAVKAVSRELYLLDGQISFDRALLYASVLNSMDADQKAYLDAMKGYGFNSWPDITNDQVKSKMAGLPQGTAVAVMTYAGDLFSWYAGSVDADVYFCPERHGTYYGSFYIKDAPAIGHEGYSIDEQLTATAGAALCDSSKGYVTQAQATVISSLVDTQRNNLYASPTSNIVQLRTQIATLLRSLMDPTVSSETVRTQVLALSSTYGDLDGENNYNYATVFSQVYKTLTSEQKTKLASLRKSIMTGTYADGTPFDYTICTTPFLYSSVITDTSILSQYISDTDYLFNQAPAVAITVTSPNGGEGWGTGSSQTITWTSNGITGNINIQLSRDGGATYSNIIANTLNDGSQAWTVTTPSSTQAMIKVVSITTPAIYDTSDASFTIAAPPAVPTLAVPAGGATVPSLTPTLDWNDCAGAASYGVQVSASSTFTSTPVNATGLTVSNCDVPSDASLTWNTTYYWRANAANSLGVTSAWSTARSFKTALGPPPAAPSGLSATALSSTRIDLAWTDNSDNETGFKVERKKVGTTSFAQVGIVGPNITSFSNATGLTANTQYIYRVRAYLGTTLNSAYSDEASATTQPLPPTAPALILPASGSTVSILTPTLDWSDPPGAATFGVQISTASTFTTTLADVNGLAASVYTVSEGTLEWGKTYYWRANAANSFGSTSKWSTVRTFKTALGPPPLAPSDLTAVTLSSTSINLAWTDNSENEAGFKIERRKFGTSTFALAATVGPNVTSYNNATGLTASTQYIYRVRAYNFASNYSAYSNEAAATTWPLAPMAPTLLLPANGASSQSMTPVLDWNDPAGAISYGVQVSASSTFTTSIVNETGLSASTYTVADSMLMPNTSYYWRANATDSYGSTSKWSAVRTFKTAP